MNLDRPSSNSTPICCKGEVFIKRGEGFKLKSVYLRSHTRTVLEITFLDLFILQGPEAFRTWHSVLISVASFQVAHHHALPLAFSARVRAWGPFRPRDFHCERKYVISLRTCNYHFTRSHTVLLSETISVSCRQHVDMNM